MIFTRGGRLTSMTRARFGATLICCVLAVDLRSDTPSTTAARRLLREGDVLSTQDARAALERHQAALAIFEAAGDRAGTVDALISTGEDYRSLSNVRGAALAFFRALDIARLIRDQRRIAEILNDIGLLHVGGTPGDLIDPLKARRYFEDAIKIRRELRDLAGLADSYSSLSNVYYSQRELSEAEAFQRKSLDLRRRLGDKRLLGESLTKLANIEDARGQHAAAERRATEALRIALETKNIAGEAGARHCLGVVVSKGEGNFDRPVNFDRSVQELTTAAKLYAQVGDRIWEARVYRDLAELHLADYRRDPSDPNVIVITTSPERIEQTLGMARDYFVKALDLMDAVAADAGSDALNLAYEARSADIYSRAIRAALSTKRQRLAFALAERAKARNLRLHAQQEARAQADVPAALEAELDEVQASIRQLQMRLQDAIAAPSGRYDDAHVSKLREQLHVRESHWADLVDRIQLATPFSAASHAPPAISVEKVQEQLAPSVTLISYVINDERLTAFVLTKRSFAALELGSASGLTEVVDEFLSSLTPSNAASAIGTELYDRVLRPVAAYVRTVEVVIVPTGPLSRIPFAALSDGGASYFGDTHELYYLPAVDFLGADAVAVILPRAFAISQASPVGLPALPFVNDEIQSIGGVYPADLCIGGDRRDFEDNVRKYQVLHVAAHAVIDFDAPQFSGIHLGPVGGESGLVTVADISRLDLRDMRLVVMSSCRSRLGTTRPGDETISLQRAALLAGARSVVASLWDVDSEVTAELMTLFYANLAQGMSRARALAMAGRQVSAIRPQPYFWASFTLTGAPGPLANESVVAATSWEESAATVPNFSTYALRSTEGKWTNSRHIDDKGLVAGYSLDGGSVWRATLWANEEVVFREGNSDDESYAHSSSDSGIAVGLIASRPVRWQSGVRQDLAELDGGKCMPSAVNRAGTIVGGCDTTLAGAQTSVRHAVRWDGVSVRDLTPASEEASFAWSINEAGIVVGIRCLTVVACGSDGPSRPAVWVNGQMSLLPLPNGFVRGSAHSINGSGQIVGDVSNETEERACIWTSGVPSVLPSLGRGPSHARAINDRGDVVGSSTGPRGEVAVLWRAGNVFDLNSISNGPDQLLLEEASSINNAGQICGEAWRLGERFGFRLDPLN